MARQKCAGCVFLFAEAAFWLCAPGWSPPVFSSGCDLPVSPNVTAVRGAVAPPQPTPDGEDMASNSAPGSKLVSERAEPPGARDGGADLGALLSPIPLWSSISNADTPCAATPAQNAPKPLEHQPLPFLWEGFFMHLCALMAPSLLDFAPHRQESLQFHQQHVVLSRVFPGPYFAVDL